MVINCLNLPPLNIPTSLHCSNLQLKKVFQSKTSKLLLSSNNKFKLNSPSSAAILTKKVEKRKIKLKL